MKRPVNIAENMRRKLLIALGAGTLANVVPAALPAFAQTPAKAPDKIWRVGVLIARARPAAVGADFLAGFPAGMRELGYVEGKNLVIEWHHGGGDAARLPALAYELVQLKPDVILAVGAQSISAAQKATATIPVVMGIAGDPVSDGFVKTLARPGGNITGTSLMMIEIMPKRLEQLLGMAPKLTRLAALFNPANSTSVASLASLQAAAATLRIKIVPAEARTVQEIESAFAALKRDKAEAMVVIPDALLNSNARQVGELTVRHHLPSVAGLREHAEGGGLLSYGPSYFDIMRRAATYVDKIFKGAKPADLPVEQPTKFELFINGKTAKALGLTIPQSLLITAEKVIE